MREHANRSIGPLLALSIVTSAGCAEQHQADSTDLSRTGAEDTPRSGDTPAPNPPPSHAGAGTNAPTGMAASPPTPSMMEPAPSSTGTTPSATPITLPPPEPFDPMRTSCGSPRASEGVWLVFSSLNRTCNADADCFVSAGAVSCSKECARGSLNVAERGNVAHWLTAVEDKYCAPYRMANCPVLAPVSCGSEEALPRCRGGSCTSVTQRCEAGCMPESPGGACRGAESCDGCPSVILEADGAPCRKPGQACKVDVGCSPNVECKQGKEPGVYRWVLFNPLC